MLEQDDNAVKNCVILTIRVSNNNYLIDNHI